MVWRFRAVGASIGLASHRLTGSPRGADTDAAVRGHQEQLIFSFQTMGTVQGAECRFL